MTEYFTSIIVIGNEHDLNRGLSKYGLRRVSAIRHGRYDSKTPYVKCLLPVGSDYQRKRLSLWFKVGKKGNTPGELECISSMTREEWLWLQRASHEMWLPE